MRRTPNKLNGKAEKIITLYNQGYTVKRIAAELNVTPRAVQRFIQLRCRRTLECSADPEPTARRAERSVTP